MSLDWPSWFFGVVTGLLIMLATVAAWNSLLSLRHHRLDHEHQARLAETMRDTVAAATGRVTVRAPEVKK